MCEQADAAIEALLMLMMSSELRKSYPPSPNPATTYFRSRVMLRTDRSGRARRELELGGGRGSYLRTKAFPVHECSYLFHHASSFTMCFAEAVNR